MADPVSLLMIPSAIVSTLHIWKSERDTRRNATIDDYLEWLRRHHHEQLVNQINDNTDLIRGIRQVLESDHDEVMAALERIERVISGVAASIAPLQPIAGQMPQLPEQAVMILKKMNEAGASRMFLHRSPRGNSATLYYSDGAGRNHDLEEARFAADDLAVLVEHGLLREVDYNKDGEVIYGITRPGAEFGSAEHCDE